MFFIVRPLRVALKALIYESTSGQLALGFAFGLLIGIVPKGNLTAIVLGIILAASRANLGIAAATIVAFSFASPWLDPASHQLGAYLLSHPSLLSMWTKLYNTPVMPWTAFNNSIVLGSFVIGMVLLYPAYRLSRPLFKRYTEKIGAWARKYWLTRILLGVEWADRLGASGS